MKIRVSTKNDVPEIVQLLANDKLGSQRERFEEPLPSVYFQAFERIQNIFLMHFFWVEKMKEVNAVIHGSVDRTQETFSKLSIDNGLCVHFLACCLAVVNWWAPYQGFGLK